MMKAIGIAVWACLVMFAANAGIGAFLKSRSAAPAAASDPAAGAETRKTSEINVPIIRGGAIKGYVLLKFSYVVDLAVAKTLSVQPDAFLVDESFRYIFDDDQIDFSHLDKIEIDKLARMLTYRVNARMKAPVITDIAVLECNFLLNAEGKPDSPEKPEGKSDKKESKAE